jgi:uncharacterized protein CbrC (UPF0167 family)
MAGSLPTFRYHPDPLATGSVEPSPAECRACDRARGFIYVGPVYAEQQLVDAFCPWCVADGTAAREFDAEFTDVGWAVPEGVPASVTDEIAHRTPGFHAWQQDHWLYHCSDGCAFLGAVGRSELLPFEEALESLRRESAAFGWDEKQVTAYVDSLTKGGSPTAYLFRCLVCSAHVAYSDFD